jgi:hypothetical protein
MRLGDSSKKPKKSERSISLGFRETAPSGVQLLERFSSVFFCHGRRAQIVANGVLTTEVEHESAIGRALYSSASLLSLPRIRKVNQFSGALRRERSRPSC